MGQRGRRRRFRRWQCGIGFETDFVLNRLTNGAFARWLEIILSNQWICLAFVACTWAVSFLLAIDRPDLTFIPIMLGWIFVSPFSFCADSAVALKIVQMGNSPFVVFVVLIDLAACVVLWTKTHYDVLVLLSILLGVGGSMPLLLTIEAVDVPLLPLLVLPPIAGHYGVNLLRFYTTGSIHSAMSEDYLIDVKYGAFSLNAFIGYAASVIFFLVVSKMIQIMQTRFFEIPVFVPGLPPHDWLPRVVQLEHRKWAMDDFWFGTPERSRRTALVNSVLTLAVLVVFFLHEIPRL
eukprot:TRINITY_DN7833_c0_g4_i2.p1 TRINITY_DN7833_c0_g4~~TRINITY_DN7833_c0_g4_i2.p1  ORF type:complete len:332 (+),score=48.50 TRINITY_DN7833_c0_g4_i2:123-998(+)